MSAELKPVTPPPVEEPRYATEEEQRSQFDTVVWFEELYGTETLAPYYGKWVAAAERRIIDAAPSLDELHRRLDALGNTIPRYRVIVRYVPSGYDDPYNWG